MDVEPGEHFIAALDEPDIDYPARVIRFDPTEYDLGAPSRAVLLHELMHLVQTDVLNPHRQTHWLTEAVCDYFAASWLDSPELLLVSAHYPALSRTLTHQFRYPDDVLSQAAWVLRLLE